MNYVKRNIASFVLAFLLVVLSLFTVSALLDNIPAKIKLVKVNSIKKEGWMINYSEGQGTPSDFLYSLSNPNSVTLLGSSELTIDSTCPHNYLPQKHNFSVLSVGHAHHQSFSMWCQLLAGKEFLKNAQVSIIFSPGWLSTEGTNVEAFLEFVPTVFLEKIWHDESISREDKIEIGRYIDQNYSLINSPTKVLNQFRLLYLTRNIPLLNKFADLGNIWISKPQIQFPNRTSKKDKINRLNVDMVLAEKNRLEFEKGILSNSQFIQDTYFEANLKSSGSNPQGSLSDVDLSNNREYEDFKLVVRLLKSCGANVSVIIQALNPYYYPEMGNMNQAIKEVELYLKENEVSTLNLYVFSKKEYIPGILNDVMHFGAYGWMLVNQFLLDQHAK